MSKVRNILSSLILVVTLATGLNLASLAYAASPEPDKIPDAQGGGVNISIPTPSAGVNPGANVNQVFSNIITIIFAIAALAVLIYIIMGAFAYLTSGGDKEKTGKAVKSITSALVGLALLALAFLIVRIVGTLIHVDITHVQLPALDAGTGR